MARDWVGMELVMDNNLLRGVWANYETTIVLQQPILHRIVFSQKVVMLQLIDLGLYLGILLQFWLHPF